MRSIQLLGGVFSALILFAGLAISATDAAAFGRHHNQAASSSGNPGTPNGGGGAPEPASLILLAAGGSIAGIKYLRNRKSQQKDKT